MTYSFRVTVTRKQGLSDPEGATTKRALHDLGFSEVGSVSFGRILSLTVDADSEEAAREQVEAMCTKLLANPVMENHTIEAV